MELVLTDTERAMLAAMVPTDGFKILDRIMRSEVFKFNTALLNAKEEVEVLRWHNLATAASKFYQGVVDQINTEIDSYLNTSKPTDAPIDVTEGNLDLGNEFVEEI